MKMQPCILNRKDRLFQLTLTVVKIMPTCQHRDKLKLARFLIRNAIRLFCTQGTIEREST